MPTGKLRVITHRISNLMAVRGSLSPYIYLEQPDKGVTRCHQFVIYVEKHLALETMFRIQSVQPVAVGIQIFKKSAP